MKTCFSEGKLTKHFGNPPFLREPPFYLTPLFLSNFFMTRTFSKFQKQETPPPNFRREETMYSLQASAYEKQGLATIAHLAIKFKVYRCVKSCMLPTK